MSSLFFMNLSLLRNLFLALTIYTNLLSWSKPVHEKWKFIVVLPIAVQINKDALKFEKTGDSCKIHTSACIPPCKKPYNPNHILIYC